MLNLAVRKETASLPINTLNKTHMWQPSIFCMIFRVVTVVTKMAGVFVGKEYHWTGTSCLHIFFPEDGGNSFRRNTVTYLQSYKAS